MILLIDNYDSFTYNLFQYMEELGEDVEVIRNDKVSLEEIKAKSPEAIVISPGPGTPSEAGICIELVQTFEERFPILGICLGHQAIAEAYGATITHAKEVKHGKQSPVKHHEQDIFDQLPNPVEVMRYHSLVVKPDTMPDELELTATALDDGEIMALKHRTLPIYGMQFHPESIGTNDGKTLLANFFKTIRGHSK
ncbi:anthranilate synthase component 2/anthranilate synthase/phosphoribosyltransferase [Pelagirhabdus alkalitolerans]|uniref:Anthranilate synthase component 2/anthranilate synthase/phosphoribosyltransferase n=1 Tax=Pelagirhabdus alkalitolerans TaxID=1612202 RepID=A0A1G6GJD0_9BACI|nr:aminodeoxychorismate/anthranilate synthase component II [Pelagirhabdus alkalitolerans]SDB82050.1 anthranilate synthase component 2/anthranilate synthase/phosphoribosyltransferase [Pelagirhabdus alkalitolerans]